MLTLELLPCPFCGQTPDVSSPAAFSTGDQFKYGWVQCCISGPEVRTEYKDIEHWKADAITAWNDRPNGDVIRLAALDEAIAELKRELYPFPMEVHQKKWNRNIHNLVAGVERLKEKK
jgi:hypothetical protein